MIKALAIASHPSVLLPSVSCFQQTSIRRALNLKHHPSTPSCLSSFLGVTAEGRRCTLQVCELCKTSGRGKAYFLPTFSPSRASNRETRLCARRYLVTATRVFYANNNRELTSTAGQEGRSSSKKPALPSSLSVIHSKSYFSLLSVVSLTHTRTHTHMYWGLAFSCTIWYLNRENYSLHSSPTHTHTH